MCSGLPQPQTHVFPQWIIAELACYTYSMVVVPLYDTLGPGAIRYIIRTGESLHPLLVTGSQPSKSPPLMLYYLSDTDKLLASILKEHFPFWPLSWLSPLGLHLKAPSMGPGYHEGASAPAPTQASNSPRVSIAWGRCPGAGGGWQIVHADLRLWSLSLE